MDNFIEVKEKWGRQYPSAIKSWEDNWDNLVTFFEYPQEIRKIIYTTNAIEGLHRQFCKITKTKQVFPHDDSLKKMLYMATRNIMKKWTVRYKNMKKWTVRYKNWDIVLSQLDIMFEGSTPA